MMGTRVMGLAPALRMAVLRPQNAMRNQVVLRSVAMKRGIQTQIMKPAQLEDVLNAQRVKRPSSPHFTIYQPQLTWVASIANRVTGSALSVLLYGFAISYVAFPLAGLPFSGADVINLVAGLPEGFKYAGKAVLALPFTFHFWNGLRHLAWDTGKFLTLKGAYSSGYAVLGATAVSTIGLCFV